MLRVLAMCTCLATSRAREGPSRHVAREPVGSLRRRGREAAEHRRPNLQDGGRNAVARLVPLRTFERRLGSRLHGVSMTKRAASSINYRLTSQPAHGDRAQIFMDVPFSSGVYNSGRQAKLCELATLGTLIGGQIAHHWSPDSAAAIYEANERGI